jgi:hypothetical protein
MRRLLLLVTLMGCAHPRAKVEKNIDLPVIAVPTRADLTAVMVKSLQTYIADKNNARFEQERIERVELDIYEYSIASDAEEQFYYDKYIDDAAELKQFDIRVSEQDFL